MPRIADRLKAFDQATARQRRRQRKSCRVGTGDGRGWQRENLSKQQQQLVLLDPGLTEMAWNGIGQL